ncbi:MAG: hypothetical protein ACPLQP_01630 [Moorellaceae bacterium]
MFYFEELDEVTRHWMLVEFFKEESSGNPYRSTRLSPLGLEVFPREMERALREGNEETLAAALALPGYWKDCETIYRRGKPINRRIDPVNAAKELAFNEFNTWYVRGLARRLMEEGEKFCQVYRAAPAWEPRAECLQHEGKIYEVRIIYDGHRARYWPPPGNPNAFSIPVGVNCHHTIRRVRK